MIYDFVLASEIKISLNEAREISPFNGTALVPKPRLSIAGSINEGETEDTPGGTALFGMLPKSQEWSGSACEASAKTEKGDPLVDRPFHFDCDELLLLQLLSQVPDRPFQRLHLTACLRPVPRLQSFSNVFIVLLGIDRNRCCRPSFARI